MIEYDDYIGKYIIYHDPEGTKNDAFIKILNNEWDIVAVRESITVKERSILLLNRDIITNIRSEDALLYLIIDDREYPIRDNTRLLTALTPFKPFILRIKSDKKYVKITYTILLMNNIIVNDLRLRTIKDGEFVYDSGQYIYLNT